MEEITAGPHLNPWFSMWTKPRATIQEIVDRDPEHLVLALAAVAGFSGFLDRAAMRSMGDDFQWPTLVLIGAIVGPISGIVGLYLFGWLLRWTGDWIGGRASSREIRTAMAWSSVPIVWALVLWVPELALFGQELFTTETPRIDSNTNLLVLFVLFGLVEMTVGIWAIVVFLKSLGQVQGFSAWKALGNSALAGLVILIPLLLVVFVVVALA